MLKVFFFLLLLPPLRLSLWLGQKRNLSLGLRMLGICGFFLISQQFTLNKLLFGGLSGPDIPYVLLLCQSAALTALVVIFFCLLGHDLVRLLGFIGRLWRSRRPKPPDPGRRQCLTGLFGQSMLFSVPALGLSAGALGVAQGTAIPRLCEHQVELAHLPEQVKGLRLALLSDLHIGPLTSLAWAGSIVEQIQAAKPDLICLAGDLADGQLGYHSADGATRREVASLFGKLSAPLGVFACTGNHEYYSDYAGWMQLYQSLGIHFLHDNAVLLPYNGATLVLGGRDDKQAGTFFHRKRQPASVVFAGMPWHGQKAVRLLLDHRPDRARENAAYADLQLSGHTHGGQCLGLDRLVARVNRGFLRGWYTVEAMRLYVCPGTGLWSGFPVRLGVASEIALISLA
ncbi:MAG: metallophosphoesterase [Desulfovibrio sp.]|nr:metallophosphoesterase [Desulfovibrio sp.]